MIFKTNLEKAFDRIKWSFIRYAFYFLLLSWSYQTLSVLYLHFLYLFPYPWQQDQILQDNQRHKTGDPISLYLFILYIELLSKKIDNKMDILNWKPISVSPSFFVCDLTLFTNAYRKMYLKIVYSFSSFIHYSS